jgi:uroporphyrin-III C-methyltransferase
MIIPYRQIINPDPLNRKGHVIIAAAGPGDPDLITVKAVNALQNAEMVLADRLVSEVILHRYVPVAAEIIRVGKESGKKGSTPQESINRLMVEFALEGRRVVRLKGGDVSIFSNILDELRTLLWHKIPYEIIPGVTAALGAAAYSGIPLTARGYANAVRFLTLYKPDLLGEADWKELAATSDTLVFYMSASTLSLVVEKMLQSGVSPEVHLAVIEQATTCYQQTFTCNIYQYAENCGGKEFSSPSLVIIGRVVQLHNELKWFEEAETHEQYFTSVQNQHTEPIETVKPLKHVV